LNRYIIPDYFFDVSDHNRPTIATPDDRQFPGPSSTTVDKEVFDPHMTTMTTNHQLKTNWTNRRVKY